jgi:hypothetical protein
VRSRSSSPRRSLIGWETKNLLFRAPPCLCRHVKPSVPAAFAVIRNGPAWWVMACSPYVRKESLCRSSGGINRLMMMSETSERVLEWRPRLGIRSVGRPQVWWSDVLRRKLAGTGCDRARWREVRGLCPVLDCSGRDWKGSYVFSYCLGVHKGTGYEGSGNAPLRRDERQQRVSGENAGGQHSCVGAGGHVRHERAEAQVRLRALEGRRVEAAQHHQDGEQRRQQLLLHPALDLFQLTLQRYITFMLFLFCQIR